MNNFWLSIGDALSMSFQGLLVSFIEFVPKLVVAIVLFAIGWVVASFVARSFEQVFSFLKLDKFFKQLGLEDFSKRAGFNLNSGYFVGQVIRWFLVVVFLLPSLSLVGLDSIGVFLKEDVLGFLPRIIVAAFVLIIATVISDAVSRMITASAKSFNIHSANMLGAVVKYAIWIFAFIIALGQLGIAPAFMQILFSGIIAMFALAGALAFGLGAKDHAGRLISRIGQEIKE